MSQILGLTIYVRMERVVLREADERDVLNAVFSSENRGNLEAVALRTRRFQSSSNAGIYERNHQPIIRVVILIHLVSEIFAILGDLRNGVGPDVKHVN